MGDVVLWHADGEPSGNAKGVFDFLNELFRELPLKHLGGTNWAAYRFPLGVGD